MSHFLESSSLNLLSVYTKFIGGFIRIFSKGSKNFHKIVTKFSQILLIYIFQNIPVQSVSSSTSYFFLFMVSIGKDCKILKIALSRVYSNQSNFVTLLTVTPFSLHRASSKGRYRLSNVFCGTAAVAATNMMSESRKKCFWHKLPPRLGRTSILRQGMPLCSS